MTFEFGDVVVAAFPYTDQSSAKRRPAVVVSTTSYNQTRPDVILAAITSQVGRGHEPGDLDLNDWEAAGLLKPSAIKLIVGTFDKSLFGTKLGCLSPADRDILRAAVEAMVGHADSSTFPSDA